MTAPEVDDQRRQAEAHLTLTTSLNSIGSSLTSDLSSRAADLHANTLALSKQHAELVKDTAGLARETDQLQKVADVEGGKLKEIGDVQNWAEMIERDLLVLEETLGLVDDDKARENGKTVAKHGEGEGNGAPAPVTAAGAPPGPSPAGP